GAMGLMHALVLDRCIAYDLNPSRVQYARSLGIDARSPEDARPAQTIFVCPGSQAAFDAAVSMSEPEATIGMFAPLGPDQNLVIPQRSYFRDLRVIHSYSCGPCETKAAQCLLRAGRIKAEMIVSEFIGIDQLPESYIAMKKGETLKPMVLFD